MLQNAAVNRLAVEELVSYLRIITLPKAPEIRSDKMPAVAPEVVRVGPRKPAFASEVFEEAIVEGTGVLEKLDSNAIMHINAALASGSIKLDGIDSPVTGSNLEEISARVVDALRPLATDRAGTVALKDHKLVAQLVETFEKTRVIARVGPAADRILDYVGNLHGPVEDDALRLVNFVRNNAGEVMMPLRVLGRAKLGEWHLLEGDRAAAVKIISAAAETGKNIPVAEEPAFSIDDWDIFMPEDPEL